MKPNVISPYRLNDNNNANQSKTIDNCNQNSKLNINCQSLADK